MRRFLPALLILLSTISFAQETLKVGVISYKSDKKVAETFKPIFQYVASQLDRQLEFTIVPEDDLAFHLDQNDFDIGVFTIFPYLRAKEDFPGLHVFASHKVAGQGSFHGVILARKSDDITDLHQMEGKKFLFVKPTSTSGYKYPKGIFTESDMDIDNNFFSFDFSYDHNKSLDSLIAGAVDGIAINESYFMGRKDINQDDYQILDRYEVPYHAYVTSPAMSLELHKQLEEIMFSAHKNPKAKKYFKNPLEVTSFVPKDDEYYNIIRRYLRITRVKPMLDLNIQAIGMATENLAKNSDVLKLIEDKVVRGLMKTRRFSEPQGNRKQYFEHVMVNIYQVNEGMYHYQVLFNDEVVDEGADISDAKLRSSLHEIIRKSVLEHLPIEAELLYNGRDWFINYGRNDGLTLTDYEFDLVVNGKHHTLQEQGIAEMTELNTHFAINDLFEKDAKVMVRYKIEDSGASDAEEAEDSSIN
ncbi:MAG: PhnD/SsuA/transferrin family substrate-binding protein, partial [Bacteroidota bacterium]